MRPKTNTTSKDIYAVVIEFCNKRGLIKKLNKSLTISEQNRFNQKNIKNDGLDILDVVHCVQDKRRSLELLDEVLTNVNPNDYVLEAGIGTGLLSYAAASKGAEVYGLEINPSVLKLANAIKKYSCKNLKLDLHKINFIKKNAFKFKTKQKFDVVISENLYTGMFYEKQIQIMNHLNVFLKRDAIVIPLGMKMGATLVNTTFPYKPRKQELFVPLEFGDQLLCNALSKDIEYSEINFSKINDLGIQKEIKFQILKDGLINSVLIWSEVILGNKKRIRRKDTTFLNNDIIIALNREYSVKKGQIVMLYIEYVFGSKPSSAILNIKIL